MQDEDLWEKRYGRKLDDEERRETKENLVAFFQILHEWKMQEAANAQFR